VSVTPDPAAGPRLEFRVLGPLQVRRDGVPVELGARKQRAVLAALVLAHGRPVSIDRLIDAVWGETAPARAQSGVQAYLSKLRTLLRPDDPAAAGILRQPPGYVLTSGSVDVAEFRRLADDAAEHVRRGEWADAAATAAAAEAWWRGPFLADLADDDGVAREAARLDEIRVRCLEAEVTGLLGVDDTAAAAARAQAIVDAHPLRETGWWLWMIALYRAGRTPEALDAYRSVATLLDEQLGLEPGRPLRDLHGAILRQDEELLWWPRTVVTEQLPEQKPQREHEPASAPATRDGTVGLVGRETEIGAVKGFLHSVTAGEPAWLLLTGPAGIGKTRLAGETVRLARENGLRTVWTSCPDDGGTPAWWPLRTVVADLGADPDALFAAPSGADADTVRFAISARLLALFRATPVVLVIDDAQWLDSTSLRWLSYLAHVPRAAGTGIVLTVRDGERHPGLDEVLETIGRRGSTVHVPVPPLDGPHATALLRQVSGDTISAADAFALIHHVGGNPLLLGEYARLPAGERRDGRIPHAARAVLDRRLRRLPEDVLTVLRAAAVIGDTFELDLLAAVVEQRLDEVVDSLDIAAAEAIVEPAAGAAGYQFRHGLLRDAVIARSTVLRRQALHARVAESLAVRVPRTHTLIQRAHHLSAALPLVGAAVVVEASSTAARAAERDWDWDAAAHQWELALDAQQHVADGEPGDRDVLLIARLTCTVRAGRPLDAVAAVADELESAAVQGEPASIGHLAAVLLRTGGTWGMGADRPDVSGTLERLLPIVREDPAARTRVLAALAVGRCNDPDPGITAHASRVALEIAENTGDPAVLADAIVGRVIAYSGVASSAEESRELFGRLSVLDHPFRDYDELLRHNLSTMVEFALGDISSVADHLQQAIRAADRYRFPVARVQMRWVEAMLAQWHGEWDRAQELIDRAYQLHRQTASWGADLHRHNAQLTLLRDRGRWPGPHCSPTRTNRCSGVRWPPRRSTTPASASAFSSVAWRWRSRSDGRRWRTGRCSRTPPRISVPPPAPTG
jgi:DNA-binding SARP family transcriptional activator